MSVSSQILALQGLPCNFLKKSHEWLPNNLGKRPR